jgi:hypothetical protein
MDFAGELASQTIELDHHCSECGAVSSARVLGEQSGMAGQDARIAAQEEAAQLIRLAPCPRCGKRGRRAASRLIGGSALMAASGVVLLLVAWVMVQIGALQDGGERLVGVTAFAAGGLPIVAFLRARSRWRGSTERVHFTRA